MEQSKLEAEIIERRDAPNTWGVEAIDRAGDGDIYMAIFSGPYAQARAVEYASTKFKSFTLG